MQPGLSWAAQAGQRYLFLVMTSWCFRALVTGFLQPQDQPCSPPSTSPNVPAWVFTTPPHHNLSPAMLKKFCNNCKVLTSGELERGVLQDSLVNPESHCHWICYSQIFFFFKTLFCIWCIFQTNFSPCYAKQSLLWHEKIKHMPAHSSSFPRYIRMVIILFHETYGTKLLCKTR